MSLAGKTALVTGGSRGIGRAVCLQLAAQGATVGINYVSNTAAADETLAAITAAGGKGFVVGFDVADSAAVQKAIKEISADHSGVDILVNNAGITRDGLMARMKESDWDAVLDTNLKGAFICSKAVIRPAFIMLISILSVMAGDEDGVNGASPSPGKVSSTN